MFLFGKKKAPPAPEVTINDAMMKQNEALSVLEKREVHVLKKIEAENASAKQFMRNGDKRSAMMALKRREMLSKQMESINNQRLTLESEKINLESLQAQKLAVDALQSTAQAQRAAKLDVNMIDKIMDDMQELKDTREEIDAVFSQHVADGVNDAELMAELDSMMAEDIETSMLNAAHVPSAPLPSNPQGVPAAARAPAVAAKSSDEDQLNALQAMLG